MHVKCGGLQIAFPYDYFEYNSDMEKRRYRCVYRRVKAVAESYGKNIQGLMIPYDMKRDHLFSICETHVFDNVLHHLKSVSTEITWEQLFYFIEHGDPTYDQSDI